MSDPEDAGKYRVENQQPVQGQVIGENNTIHQYFSSASGSIPIAPPIRAWNVPFSHNLFFTGREEILAQIRARFQTDHATALSQPQAMSGLGGVVRHEAARVIVSCNNGVRTKPAVPPAVSLNGEAGRQQPVRSPLTTTLNRTVGSQTARGSWYLLASKRIRSQDEWYG